MKQKFKIAVGRLVILALLVAGCDGDTRRGVTKIQDDGEDFSVSGDEDNDALMVDNFASSDRSIAIRGGHNLCNPLNQAVLIADWSDGTTSQTTADPRGRWTLSHTYGERGEYAIEIRCYCNKRLVGRDSDIVLIPGAPGGTGGTGGGGGGGTGGSEGGG